MESSAFLHPQTGATAKKLAILSSNEADRYPYWVLFLLIHWVYIQKQGDKERW